MRDILIVLNPRRITECVDAFKALRIDKLWVRGMTEYQIEVAWPDIMAKTAGYDRILMGSDDGIPRPHALEEVRRWLGSLPVVTGYSNLAANDMRVNLTRKPTGPEPKDGAYDLYHLSEVMEHPAPLVPTWFAGMALTGMTRELWQEFPFQTFRREMPGNASDFMLSQRLCEAKIPILAARDAFVWHVKETWNRPDRDERKRLYLDEQEVVFECG